MSVVDINPGDYLFCTEDEMLYTFVGFEGNNIRVRDEGGKEPVLPYKKGGHTFLVIKPKDIGKLNPILKTLSEAMTAFKEILKKVSVPL